MRSELVRNIQSLGWTKFSSLMSPDYVPFAKATLEKVKNTYKELQIKAGLYQEAQGTMHHLAILCPELVEATFNDTLWSFLEDYFCGKFILGSFGSTILEPNGTTSTQKMHRDARDSYSAQNMLVLIILLDDSFEKNGATKMIEKSHLSDIQPTDREFEEQATSISGQAGDVIALNPYAWHATGRNITERSRTIITPMVTRPFIKPGVDYIRGIGENNVAQFNDRMKQILGYYSRVPASLSDFYQPKNKRFFRANQI